MKNWRIPARLLGAFMAFDIVFYAFAGYGLWAPLTGPVEGGRAFLLIMLHFGGLWAAVMTYMD